MARSSLTYLKKSGSMEAVYDEHYWGNSEIMSSSTHERPLVFFAYCEDHHEGLLKFNQTFTLS